MGSPWLFSCHYADKYSYAPINVKPAVGGGGAWGRDLMDRSGPGVEHLNYLADPWVGLFEYFANI